MAPGPGPHRRLTAAVTDRTVTDRTATAIASKVGRFPDLIRPPGTGRRSLGR
ncbi:hypothetical protein ACFFX0_02475 [Citricoccus parietis]|uniref:Uncharacterized protein n=1 Tax=Citricoccus parietis TaxID=592307 RepID=A0ABV5FTX3_9MICC